MIVGDALRMFHRHGQPQVRDSNGMPIRIPPIGVMMPAAVTEVITNNLVHLTATDMDRKTFVERFVVVLEDNEPVPRGGRYALRVGDVSIHPLATQYGR
jgi:hypothetical protein